MKALITLILASLVFTSCSTMIERDQYVPRRVKPIDNVVIVVRLVDTLFVKGDTISVREFPANQYSSSMIKAVVQ